MDSQDLNRRDFHRLTMAALGGVLAGTAVGCGSNDANSTAKSPASGGATSLKDGSSPKNDNQKETTDAPAEEAIEVKGDPHACSGLNACKGQGATGKNECAGQGECASVAWHHTCAGQNACKGQGGCGQTATINDCKGKGACHIPLMGAAWKTARKHFEEKMKAEEKEIGEGKPPKLKLKAK